MILNDQESSRQNPKILVFIPVFNCEKQIPRVIKQFKSKSVQKKFSELLIIDNRSSDKTVEAAKKELNTLQYLPSRIIQNTHNYNLGGSHKVAFLYALKKDFDYIIVLHGDDQADLHDILPHINSGAYKNVDCLLGSRFAKKSTLIGYSKLRIWGNRLVNLMCSIISHKNVTDTGSGLNLYKVSALRSKFFLNLPNDLTFNVYLLMFMIWRDFSIIFFPLVWREEDQVSNAKVFRQGIIISKLFLNYFISPRIVFSPYPNRFSLLKYEAKTIFSTES